MNGFKSWIKQNHSIALVILGLVIALTKLLPPVSLTHDIAFFIILPPILFQGGMLLDRELLIQDWKPIGLLAVPGIVASALLVGYPLSYFWHIPLIYALLFGALISPTDPVSVLAIIKRIKAPQRLQTILEAESLFNDGTGVVLFLVILSMVQNNEPLNLKLALCQFFIITGGGALVGFLCGYFIRQVLKLVDNQIITVSLTVILAFASPLIAESLHSSGIIAVVVAGLMMGGSHVPSNGRKIIRTFWKSMEFVMTSLVFFVIGLQLQTIGENNLLQCKWFILMGIAVVLISRILVVYPVIFASNRISKNTIPLKWGHILFWGGLRGAIPIILMLQLPEFQWRPLFLSATFGIVLFSTIIQGLTIEGLLKQLKVYS